MCLKGCNNSTKFSLYWCKFTEIKTKIGYLDVGSIISFQTESAEIQSLINKKKKWS